MVQKVSTSVSVGFVFDHKTMRTFPKWIIWNKRVYQIIKVGLHHKFRQGRNLYHVFSVSSKNLFFRLVLNTQNLHWRLEEISDGMPD